MSALRYRSKLTGPRVCVCVSFIFFAKHLAAPLRRHELAPCLAMMGSDEAMMGSDEVRGENNSSLLQSLEKEVLALRQSETSLIAELQRRCDKMIELEVSKPAGCNRVTWEGFVVRWRLSRDRCVPHPSLSHVHTTTNKQWQNVEVRCNRHGRRPYLSNSTAEHRDGVDCSDFLSRQRTARRSFSFHEKASPPLP